MPNTRRRLGRYPLTTPDLAYNAVFVRHAFPHSRTLVDGTVVPDVGRLTIVATRHPHRYARLFRKSPAWVNEQVETLNAAYAGATGPAGFRTVAARRFLAGLDIDQVVALRRAANDYITAYRARLDDGAFG